MLDGLQTQPFTAGFHLAIPQGIFAGLRVAVGGRAHKSGGVLQVVPADLLVATGRFKQPAPRCSFNFNTKQRRVHASSASYLPAPLGRREAGSLRVMKYL
ncbi:hypothetical protein IB75_14670 [Nitrosococcus oceani C-27]|uniref:Uncharacterized protein n=1 Tax=Nitrosococcus oceani C-27 TaxID=314279 RepID=A0A0E2YYW2_9GAMM|nr:hypothetical protein IB75_14670 [Nitrosococcus oceani C-27]